MSSMASSDDSGPTGAICFDLPSPYLPHPNGLMHLPRFLAKIRKHLAGELPTSYRKNFCRGFDRFLCIHLGVDPADVVEAARAAPGVFDLEARLETLLPDDVGAAEWNRELTHKGMTEAGRGFLKESLRAMGCDHKIGEIVSVCDLIDLDEGRIPGFSEERRRAWQARARPSS